LVKLLTNSQHQTASGQESSGAESNDYHAQLDHLLNRIEESTTHYETLGLEHTAAYEQIMQAYEKALNMLYPAYKLRIAMEEKLLERMDAAFSKLSWAFAILANFRKRGDYHSMVLSKASHAAAETPASRKKSTSSTLQAISEARKTSSTVPAISQLLSSDRPANINDSLSNGSPVYELKGIGEVEATQVYNEFTAASKDDNRRRSQRFRLNLPARVAGFDRSGNKWHEMTQSIDASRTGVTVKLKRRVRQNTILYLSLPLPAKLRTHGFSDNSFSTYALVRRVELPKTGGRIVALEFIGEYPPQGFLEKPWATFRPGKWSGQERRRNSRENRVEKIRLEYFNDALASLGSEEAFTENVSPSGLRTVVKRAPFEFDLVRVTCLNRDFESLAAVRNRYIARDGTERLCLHYLNSSFQPL
jgi:hypothetical protein